MWEEEECKQLLGGVNKSKINRGPKDKKSKWNGFFWQQNLKHSSFVGPTKDFMPPTFSLYNTQPTSFHLSPIFPSSHTLYSLFYYSVIKYTYK